jgi:integrase
MGVDVMLGNGSSTVAGGAVGFCSGGGSGGRGWLAPRSQCTGTLTSARQPAARVPSPEAEREGTAERDDATVNDRPKEDVMESTQLVDCAGRRRSPATLPGYHRRRPPRNKGLRYPADPPTVDEIISVMRAAGDSPDGVRLRGVIVVLWRAGLRISEALALNESDLDSERGAVLVAHGKGDKRREVGMDRWAWEQLRPWLELRATLPGVRCIRLNRVERARGGALVPASWKSHRRCRVGVPSVSSRRVDRRDVPRCSSDGGHRAVAGTSLSLIAYR